MSDTADDKKEQTTEQSAPQTAKEKYTERLKQPSQIQDEPEQELWRGGYSPKALYGEWIFGAVISIVLVVLVGMYLSGQPLWWQIIGAVIGIWVLYEVLKILYMRLSIRYRLTNQRFIHEKGIIRRVTDRIEVIDVNDVGFEQGFVERFFGVGTIRIDSTDATHPVLHLHGIENVEDVAHKIDDARRKERIRRGVQVINT